MSGGLYSLDILRLAAGTSAFPRLGAPSTSEERRTRTCGSRIVVDLTLDHEGRVTDYGHFVQACAVGQAAATVVGRAAIGRTPDELVALAAEMRAFLTGEADAPPAVAGAKALGPVRGFPARHEAAMLAFDTAAAAATRVEPLRA